MRVVKTRMHLLKMPFDKYEDNVGFVHATGDYCQFEDGHWEMEYEDDVFDDAPGLRAYSRGG